MIPLQNVIRLVRLIADILAGNRNDALSVAKELMNEAVAMIPVEDLKGALTDRDRIFADLAADIAEQLKLEALKRGP
jgi:hypothetical protein